ncbi:hypothetical protein CYMTET_27974 [Cymbomonas tetramitiformis]|uniref:Uncharacterized protein n=1 Tax=Cymbomonas tetramitiformis TaxID=36881 RepID=A0AAE0FNP2_9CHLO|nr:hypothetical protein CYMTET_27974 [Cymbomonas tetramitiformis]
MWGLTDPHADTNGLCPWAVGEPQQPAAFPFRPHALTDSLPDPLDVLEESELDDCPSADDDGPLNPTAFAIAADGNDDDEECWPALADTPLRACGVHIIVEMRVFTYHLSTPDGNRNLKI